MLENYSADWPQSNEEIDLKIHDLPHRSSTTEWWYMHSHVTAKGGRKFSLFASFFIRMLGYDKKNKEPIYAYSLTWAIADLDEKEYYTCSLVDKKAPKIGLKRIRKGEIVKDPYIRRAVIEILKKDKVPYPDEMFKGDVHVAWDKLHLDYDGNTFIKKKNGTYALSLNYPAKDIAVDIQFTPQKPAIRHGNNGVVAGVKAEDMFYYFIPKCEVKGSLIVNGEKFKIEEATGWYDHEFGLHNEKTAKKNEKRDVAWNWVAMQLDNDCEITAYDLIDEKTRRSVGSYLIYIDQKGKRTQINDFKLKPVGSQWTSTRTFNDYPTRWKLTCKAIKLDVDIEASFPEQEFGTVISKPAFWEARMEVKGKLRSKNVSGPAYFERSGFHKIDTLKDFFKIVSRETLKSVARIIPLSLTQPKFEELVSKDGNKGFTRGLDKKQYIEALIKPIREITDRGGKSWRSYATIACADIVGGNSQKAKDWMALPELMHVGSLMVDDVQDKSEIRRGGLAAHHLYGEATAINSGSAAYFLGQICVYESSIDPMKKLEIYHLYFEALRAAHSGQAMDIHGFEYMMDDVIKNDKGSLLAKRVKATHRLKSAAPASYLARIGSMLGNGTPEQTNGLADYFEALGISFQIIDDTLNLKGFKDHLKTKGEDITAGKITYPVAKAFAVLNKKDRKRLWEILQMQTEDVTLITEAVTLLDKNDSIEKSEKEAKSTLERAWKKLDPLVEDSMVKLNLRAFSWYVLERTY